MGTIQTISFAVTGCLSFWISDGLANSMWAQVGYFICNSSTPYGFFQIWNLATGKMMCACGNGVLLSRGYHTFSMYLQSGTIWAFKVNNTLMGTYDMGTSISSSTYPVYALSEENGVTKPYAVPMVEFPQAIRVQKAGVWQSVSSAKSDGDAWGVRGQMQTSSLLGDQIQVGGSLPYLPVGSVLWNPTGVTDSNPPSARILSPAPGAALEGTVPVSISASDNLGVTKVQLFVDSVLYSTLSVLYSTLFASPYDVSLSTTKFSDGTHTLVAKAYDAAGDVGVSASVSVSFVNPLEGILTPSAGASVSGTVSISASVTSAVGIKNVKFLVDGTIICTDSLSPYT